MRFYTENLYLRFTLVSRDFTNSSQASGESDKPESTVVKNPNFVNSKNYRKRNHVESWLHLKRGKGLCQYPGHVISLSLLLPCHI